MCPNQKRVALPYLYESTQFRAMDIGSAPAAAAVEVLTEESASFP